MSLLRAALDGVLQIRADMGGTPAPWDDFWYQSIGQRSSTGMRVNPESAKGVSTVLSCVNKIAKTVAMLPHKIYTEMDNGGKRVAQNHPLFDVLYSRPNDQQTAFEWRQMMQGHLELRGNAYSEIIPGRRGAVDQLVPMHPDRVTPEATASGRLRYRYNDPANNQDRFLAQEEVFHLRNFMDNGFVGQSTISLAVDVIGTAMAAQDYYARFLQNDARPGFFFTGANFKTKEGQNDFIRNFQAGQTGGNRHKAAVLPAGMDIKPLGVTGRDAELLDARKFSRIEICSIFDVPPHLIGETEKTATYASVEQFNIMFATYCILPRLVLWEQAVQRSLIFSSKYFSKFSMGALLRGDNASRAAFYEKMITLGVFSQNDVRIMEDLNPIPDGDNYWRPLNWARLGDVHNSVDGPATGGEDNTAEQTTNNGEGSTGAAKPEHMKLLAVMAAEPCVRKEVNAIRRVADRAATPEELRVALKQFYSDHAVYLSERMKLPPTKAREYCDTNLEFIAGATDSENLNRRLDAVLSYGTQMLGRTAVEVIQ